MSDLKFLKQHISTKVFNQYIRFFTEVLKDFEVVKKIEDIGLPISYLQNETNWVSITYAESFNKILLQHFGASRDVHYEVGEFGVTKSGMGIALYGLLRNVFSIKYIYSNMWKIHSHFNKLISISVISNNKNNIVLRLSPKYTELSDDEIASLKFCFPFVISNSIGAYESLPLVKDLRRIEIKREGSLFDTTLKVDYPFNFLSPLFKKFLIFCMLYNAIWTSLIFKIKMSVGLGIGLLFANLFFYLVYKVLSFKIIVDNTDENLRKIDEQYKDLYIAKGVVQKKFAEENAINKITTNLIKSATEVEILVSVCEDLKKYLNFDRTVIYLSNEKQSSLGFAAGVLGDDPVFSSFIKNTPFDINIADADPRKIANIFKNRKGMAVQDVNTHSSEFSEEGRFILKLSKSKSFLIAPIFSENETFGVILADRFDSSNMLNDDDLSILQVIACQVAVTLEKIRSNNKLAIAYSDTKALADSYARFVPWESLKMLNYESIHDVKIGDGLEKEMTILFSDIRGFSTLSESMQPNEILKFLNSYFGRLSPIIKKHSGTIDKFIGDGFMARFLTPQDAVNASLEIHEELEIYNSERVLEGRKIVRAGIGIATGTVVTGPLGFDGRMEITVISDIVNKASRIEGLCSSLKETLLICSTTQKNIVLPAGFLKKTISDVVVKGREERFDVFAINKKANVSSEPAAS